jgi:uncharacterized RDD family membrane protein YckC
MKPTSQALRAGLVLAALVSLSLPSFAADPAKPQDTAAPAPEAPLHEIGASAADTSPTATPTPTARDRDYRRDDDDDGRNRVSVGDATIVARNEVVPGNAVSVFGPLTVDGTVNGNAVSILGSNTINGTVHGNAVVVLGTLRIGPNAHIEGNAVAGVGVVIREPGAIVDGNVVQQGGSGLDLRDDSGARTWFSHGFRLGRPVAFGPHLHVFWIFNACLVVFYVLLALIFPVGVTKCGDTLARRPGLTILTGVLSIIALPVLFVLLLVTIVGIPVAIIVLPLAAISALIFGKTAIYAFIGRSTVCRGMHPAVTVLVGAAIVMALYFIPFLGGALWFMVAFLGFACALTTLFTLRQPAPPAALPPVAPVPPVVPVAPVVMAAAVPAEGATISPVPLAVPGEVPSAPLPATPAMPVLPPPLSAISEAALPRAGFWIRIIALMIDCLLVGMVTRMHDWFPIILAVYGAVLWKLRGATIGDIIFGLKVVRADGGQTEWVTVIVRALACFFSIVVCGLGFIWIAFDREKQGWHDKIAGTLVVRLPKGASLV